MAKRAHLRASKRVARRQRALAAERRRRQQQAERRRTAAAIVGGLVVGAALIGAVLVPGWLHSRQRAATNKVGAVSTPTAAALAAGCTGIRNDPSLGRKHETSRITYTESPPASGPHNPNPLPLTPQFYPVDNGVRLLVERAVHSLEHGFVIGWYDRSLPAAQVSALQSLAGRYNRFIAVPWTRGTFPNGQHFVLTAWQRTQRCTTVSPTVIQQFTSRYVDASSAPEAGAGGGSAVTLPPARPTPPARTPTPTRSPSRPVPTPTP